MVSIYIYIKVVVIIKACLPFDQNSVEEILKMPPDTLMSGIFDWAWSGGAVSSAWKPWKLHAAGEISIPLHKNTFSTLKPRSK